MMLPLANKTPPVGAVRVSSPRRLRAALMGAVAVAAVAGTAFGLQGVQAATGDTSTITTAPNIAPINGAPQSFADIVEKVKGAVVSVKVKTMDVSAAEDDDSDSSPTPENPLDRFFKHFGDNGHLPQTHPSRPHSGLAQGSGFLISADGYVVTNNHVVENATEVAVTTPDGHSLPAQVVGLDKKTDLALLKVKGDKPFPFVTFAPTQPRVGDWVLAVGNPFGLGGTVTAGIVSARGRDIGAGPYDDFLQIDAPVNRGNSGGPTFNTSGQVVGVNTAIYSPSGGSVGIGFAITADVVKNVVASLEKTGSVSRGWIGVQIQPVTDDIAESLNLKSTDGALVAETQKDSPALSAGIKSGDIIVGVNNEAVEGPRELARKIASLGPGVNADITYLREGKQQHASVKLGALPGEAQQKTAKVEEPRVSTLASLGLELQAASAVAGASSKDGVVVTKVDPNGAAAQRGLRSGDVILEAAGKVVSTPDQLLAAIDGAKKDGRKAILLRVKSEDGTRYIALGTQKVS